jgi:CDGSH-type Zn-finger protein
MEKAKIAQKAPYEQEMEAGKKYAWCACGHSKNQPYCDGRHMGTGITPVIGKMEEKETVYFCGCKQTNTPPFCDGSHNDL